MRVECAYRISVGTSYSSGGMCGKQGHIQDTRMADSDPGDSDVIRKREPTTKILKFGTLNCFMRAVVVGSTVQDFPMLIQNLEGSGENDLPSSQWSQME